MMPFEIRGDCYATQEVNKLPTCLETEDFGLNNMPLSVQMVIPGESHIPASVIIAPPLPPTPLWLRHNAELPHLGHEPIVG